MVGLLLLLLSTYTVKGRFNGRTSYKSLVFMLFARLIMSVGVVSITVRLFMMW